MATAISRCGGLLVALFVAHSARLSRRSYGGQIHPGLVGLPRAEELSLRNDTATLVNWHVPPQGDRPLIIFLHGGTTPLRGHVARFRRMTADGTGLVAPSLRGYGGSTGWPSEAGLVCDATTVYRFVRSRYPSHRIVLWGYSLGSAIAVALATKHPLDKLILEAPFANAGDFVASRWLLPFRAVVRNQLCSDRRIAKVSTPMLVLHGERDEIVPIACGRRLFALASGPKRFVPFPKGGHGDLDAHGALRVVRHFLSDRSENSSGQE